MADWGTGRPVFWLHQGSSCSLVQAKDDRTMHRSVISSCQSAATSSKTKAFLVVCMFACLHVTVKDLCGGSKSRVFVLGPESGHSKLTDIARQLSAEVAMQRLSVDSITIPYVDSVIQGESVLM